MSTQAKSRSNRQGIAWRLALGLGAVFVMIGLVSVSCLWALFDIHARLHALKEDEQRARSVVGLASAVRDQYAHVAHTIIIGNDSHAKLFREATHRLEALAGTVRGEVGAPSKAEVDRIVAASKEIERVFETQVLPLQRSGDHASLVACHERIMNLAFQAQAEVETLAGAAEASLEDLNHHVRATEHGVIRLTIWAHLLALLTAVIVGVYLYRTIARPISALSAAASRVGAGDLDCEIVIEREDELGRLSRRFNEMVRSMKEHQKKLLASERLVDLATMSAGIAHELNNPIGVILGYAKLLRRGENNADPKVLEAIEEEAERCHQVVEGLLQLSRGGFLHTAPVDLRALADDVLGRFRVKGGAHDVVVEIHGHATAQGDESKLRQVLTNLIGNAFDACGQTGRVVILVDEPKAGITTVEIADTGPGIPGAALDRAFEPFFTTKPTGSGLGLAISRAIARAHGGEVAVVSTGDRGTIFRLSIPGKSETA